MERRREKMEKKVENLVELNGLEEVMGVLSFYINENEDNIEWMEKVMVESGVYCIEVGSRGEWENIELFDEYDDRCEYEGMSEDGNYYEVGYGDYGMDYGLLFVKVKIGKKE
jgi:hypothetical protein